MVTHPPRLALACMLTGGDHGAGVVLNSVYHWYSHARAKIPKLPGKWVANDRAFWMRETVMSEHQISRNFCKLTSSGLVERKQFWFGRRNILHVRPTQTAQDFVDIATTWKAAAEYVELFANKKHPTEVCSIAKPIIANLQNPESSVTAEPGSAMVPMSNYIETNTSNQTSELQLSLVSPATKSKVQDMAEDVEEADPFSINDLVVFWTDYVKAKLQSENFRMSPKQIGGLARLYSDLGEVRTAVGKIDLRANAQAILYCGGQSWKAFENDVTLYRNFGFSDEFHYVAGGFTQCAFNAWVEAGKPSTSAGT